MTCGIGGPRKTSTGTCKTINVDCTQNKHSHSIAHSLKPKETYIVIEVCYL